MFLHQPKKLTMLKIKKPAIYSEILKIYQCDSMM